MPPSRVSDSLSRAHQTLPTLKLQGLMADRMMQGLMADQRWPIKGPTLVTVG